VLQQIQAQIGDRIAFEAGPNRFPDLPVYLIQELGLEVSLANLQAGQLLHVERYRLGLDRHVHYRFVNELMGVSV
jgi:phosphosulfolactate synthase (CoM biosynthesis protein A)